MRDVNQWQMKWGIDMKDKVWDVSASECSGVAMAVGYLRLHQ